MGKGYLDKTGEHPPNGINFSGGSKPFSDPRFVGDRKQFTSTDLHSLLYATSVLNDRERNRR